MSIASEKKNSHVVEYLLYVWQMEDLVRALNFDAGAIRGLMGDGSEEDLRWMLELARDMERQKLQESGHVDHAVETLTEFALLHDLLIGPMEDKAYVRAFETAEPHLEALRSRSGQPEAVEHPVIGMMTALYGWLVLRMKRERLATETESSLVAIREMANALARGHIRVYQGR